MIGTTISHYRITEKLGEGGMGVVYKAEDTKLDRPVALKFLAPHLLRDDEGRERFQREAKAAARLDHPNICTVHEIDEAEGRTFIAMAFLEGRPLSERIQEGPLKLPEALSIAIQMAEGLEAAHEKGITHRDIKPDNIMLMSGSRGLVKLMDFGLALPAGTSKLTQHGTLLGTINYMSPEQAEGARTGHTTDIWSLGVVLYEMVAGEKPFRGDFDQAVVFSIIHEPPEPLTALRTGVPKELERIVDKCLAKKSEERYQHADELLVDLQALRRELEPQPSKVAPTPITAKHTSPAIIGAWSAVLLVALGLGWWLTHSTQEPPPRYKLTELTKDAGLTTDPALSPDGTFVAYASDRGGKGNLDIWTQPVGGGQPIRLTSDEANDYQPSYSGDGTQIAFRSDRDGGGIYLVSATGGESRLLAKGGNLPTFSPDGRWVAYSVGRLGQSCHIYVAPVAGGPSRQVEIDLPWSSAPVWSPSGKELLFLGADKTVVYAGTEANLWVAPFEGGKAVKTDLFDVLDSGELDYPGETSFGYAWSSDGGHLVFSASFGDSVNLWRIPISRTTWQITGEPQQLTGGRQDGQPSMSRDGLMAYSRQRIDFDIWGVEIDANRGEKRGEPTRVTQGTAWDQFASVDADGSALVFMSDRSGNEDVWMKDLKSAKEPRQLTFTPENEWRALISPDGLTVAFARGPYGKVEVYILPVAGGVEKKVVDDAVSIFGWSSDSKKVLYSWGEPVRPSVVDIETGQITHLISQPEYPVHNSQYSPDDRWLSFTVVEGPEDAPIYIAPLLEESVAEQSEWIQITKGPLAAVGGRNWWSPDGQMLYFLAGTEGSRRIWAQPLDAETKEPRRSLFEVLTFPGPRFQLFSRSGYGLAADTLYQAVQETNGNIWLAEPVEAE